MPQPFGRTTATVQSRLGIAKAAMADGMAIRPDCMIADQRDFVTWWEAGPGQLHGAGRGHKNNADRHSFSVEEAEALTGVKQMAGLALAHRARRLDDERA